MRMKRRIWIAVVCVALFSSFLPVGVLAETYTLSGKVSDPSGKAVPSATVYAKNVATGKSFSSKSGSDGTYAIQELPGGDYMVAATAGELQAPPIKVTLAAAQTTDLVVAPAPRSGEGAPSAPQQKPPLR